MNKFNIDDMEDKMLKICDEILDEKWNSSCNLDCSGIKCENCFFGDTVEECNNRDTEVFKFLAKSYKDKHSTGINNNTNNMNKELTFREVIAQIKEGEVWESENINCDIRIKKDSTGITIRDFKDNALVFFSDSWKFKLKRSKYTFEEAFKAYEEGKEIESCVSGYKYKKGNSFSTILCGQDYIIQGCGIPISDICGNWYINE